VYTRGGRFVLLAGQNACMKRPTRFLVDRSVMVRKIGQSREEAIPLSEIRRREMQQAELIYHQHRLLALQLGAAVTVDSYTGEMWWFVADIDGPQGKLTAKTIMFDVAMTKTFSFALVKPRPAYDVSEEIEANIARRRLGLRALSEFVDRDINHDHWEQALAA
jgi:hypothetical protein